MMFMGQSGYLHKAKQVMETCVKLKDAVGGIPELKVVGTPHMTGFAIVNATEEVRPPFVPSLDHPLSYLLCR